MDLNVFVVFQISRMHSKMLPLPILLNIQTGKTQTDRADYADIDTKPNFLFLNKPKVKDMKLSSFIVVVHICLSHGRQKKRTEFEMIAIEALQN